MIDEEADLCEDGYLAHIWAKRKSSEYVGRTLCRVRRCTRCGRTEAKPFGLGKVWVKVIPPL